jgi:acetate kinase
VCKNLRFLGVKIDPILNDRYIHGKEGRISTPDSSVAVYVINTNEELVIARDTKEIVEKAAAAAEVERVGAVLQEA